MAATKTVATTTTTEPTGLALAKPSEFALLTPGSPVREAMLAIEEAGERLGPADLIRVKTPTGGSETWMIADSSGETPTKELVGAFVGWQKAAVLWPSDDPAPGTRPVLRSHDCETAEQVGEIPKSMDIDWEKYRTGSKTFNISELDGFPYMQFGSGKNGFGKRMKEQRVIYLLRPEDAMPLYVVVQPGSVRQVSRWFVQLNLDAKKIDPKFNWRNAMIRLTLRKKQSQNGSTFAEVVPTVAGWLGYDTAAGLHRMWGATLASLHRQIVETATDADSGE